MPRDLLVVAEEASGMEPHAWEAIDSLKYQRLIAIGNPIRPDGRFVELIRQAERDRREDDAPTVCRVNAIQIPSTDSPHAELDHSPDGLADKTWMDACFRRYGKDSLWCASHIYARIPTTGQDRSCTKPGSTGLLGAKGSGPRGRPPSGQAEDGDRPGRRSRPRQHVYSRAR